MHKYDLITLGAGPAGFYGAIQAAKMGKRVACVDMRAVGGLCLNWGCVPSKALIKSAELFLKMQHAGDFGLSCEKLSFDYAKIVGRSRAVVDQVRGGAERFLKSKKIDFFNARGELIAPGQVRLSGGDLEGKVLEGSNILIATGCKTRKLPGLEFDAQTILSSREVLARTQQPKSILIIGGGAIGVEFAYFFNALGTQVTLLEAQSRILPVEDAEVSQALEGFLKKQGMSIHTGAAAQNIERTQGGVRLALQGANGQKQALEAECLLVAIGVEASLEGVVAKQLPLACDARGYIQVNERYQTSIPGVYAAGDIIGAPWLAHVAEHNATQAVLGMFSDKKPLPPKALTPGCTYCYPQVASIGLTEAQAKEQGLKHRIGKAFFSSSATAVASGTPEGFVKLVIAEPYGEILGAHIIGPEATELIAECALAIQLEATAEDLAQTLHAHPTLYELISHAAAGL